MNRISKPKPTSTLSIEESLIKNKKQQICSIVKRKTKEKFLSESQKEYYQKLTNNQISICSGPAGVGKSYTKENVVLTCYSANIGRNDNTVEVWEEFIKKINV